MIDIIRDIYTLDYTVELPLRETNIPQKPTREESRDNPEVPADMPEDAGTVSDILSFHILMYPSRWSNGVPVKWRNGSTLPTDIPQDSGAAYDVLTFHIPVYSLADRMPGEMTGQMAERLDATCRHALRFRSSMWCFDISYPGVLRRWSNVYHRAQGTLKQNVKQSWRSGSTLQGALDATYRHTLRFRSSIWCSDISHPGILPRRSNGRWNDRLNGGTARRYLPTYPKIQEQHMMFWHFTSRYTPSPIEWPVKWPVKWRNGSTLPADMP